MGRDLFSLGDYFFLFFKFHRCDAEMYIGPKI